MSGARPSGLAVVKAVGRFVTVEDLKVTDAPMYAIQAKGAWDTIGRDTVARAGGAVLVTGRHAVVTGMTARNLHMITDTRGGNDDYGAVGYDIQAADATVEHSSCTHCIAPSYDYGHDGGFVEIWNAGDNLLVQDNVATDTQGFMEIGGGPLRRQANHVTIMRNVMKEVHGGIYIHGKGTFAIHASRVVISHNLIVDRHDQKWQHVLGGALRAVTFTYNEVRSDISVAQAAPAVHYGNRYTFRAGAERGF